MQTVVNSIDKAKAISLATSSADFQTKVHGFKYIFSNIFTNMTENQEKCGDVKLTSIAIEFSVLNSTSNFVKFVQVGEDPTISQITSVEDIFVQKCSNNCPLPSPPAENTVQEILSPLRQIAEGTAPQDVKCSDGFTLVIKSEDGSPACVTDSGMGRMTRQGWWAWNNNVGNAIINNTGKKEFESKDCAISEAMSAIVGTNGFVLDDLPVNGTIFYGADTSRMVAGVTQFAVHPGNTAQITLTYDFNPYPGSNCKVTTSDVISNVDPLRPNATISELINSPDMMKVDENSVNTSIPPLGNSGDILLNLASVKNLNDHVVKATYQIFAKPDAQLGKSYYVGFWWHSAIVVTVGDSLYTGHAFDGTHYG